MIRDEHGGFPYVLLHLAGLYNDCTAVPALAKQIARIYERDVKNRLYAGYASAGQAFVHKDDMINAFCRVMGHDYRAEISRPHRCMDRGAV